MARAKDEKATLDFILFQAPEQRVLKLLLNEPTTSFQIRTLATRLKGVRGLGGAAGIGGVLDQLEGLGFVDFLDHKRSVRLRDENTLVQTLKVVAAVCELESLSTLLKPLSERGILIGSRATGKARSDSDYDVIVVGGDPVEILKIAERHPLGKSLKVTAVTESEFALLGQKDPKLALKIERGQLLWLR